MNKRLLIVISVLVSVVLIVAIVVGVVLWTQGQNQDPADTSGVETSTEPETTEPETTNNDPYSDYGQEFIY